MLLQRVCFSFREFDGIQMYNKILFFLYTNVDKIGLNINKMLIFLNSNIEKKINFFDVLHWV